MAKELRLDKAYAFPSPAKINFHLNIPKKRPDGYHQIFADFFPITLFDRIELLPSKGDTPSFYCNLPISPDSNTLTRIVRLLESRLDLRLCMDIRLEKKIPVEAGLGGGSGNAGTLLKVLDHLFRLGLKKPEFEEMAQAIGADVVFFLNPFPCAMTGLGERLAHEIRIPELEILVLHPNFGISTAEAYASITLGKSFPVPHRITHEYLLRALPEINRFWNERLPFFDKLQNLRRKLLEMGVGNVLLTGSGSSLILMPQNPSPSLGILRRSFPDFMIQPAKIMKNFDVIDHLEKLD